MILKCETKCQNGAIFLTNRLKVSIVYHGGGCSKTTFMNINDHLKTTSYLAKSLDKPCIITVNLLLIKSY